MAENELRRILAALDAALAAFKEKRPDDPSVGEVRARLSIAGARRQLQACLDELGASSAPNGRIPVALPGGNARSNGPT